MGISCTSPSRRRIVTNSRSSLKPRSSVRGTVCWCVFSLSAIPPDPARHGLAPRAPSSTGGRLRGRRTRPGWPQRGAGLAAPAPGLGSDRAQHHGMTPTPDAVKGPDPVENPAVPDYLNEYRNRGPIKRLVGEHVTVVDMEFTGHRALEMGLVRLFRGSTVAVDSFPIDPRPQI